MERRPLSIRKFAEGCGVSHIEIGRKMTSLGISGTPQGKELPTLLSPAEQDKIAAVLFVPAEPPATPAQHVYVLGSGLSVYTPPPLATRGVNSELSRHLQQQQLTQALGAFKGNQASFKDTLLGMAAEPGHQLGHKMAVTEKLNSLPLPTPWNTVARSLAVHRLFKTSTWSPFPGGTTAVTGLLVTLGWPRSPALPLPLLSQARREMRAPTRANCPCLSTRTC